MVPSQHSGFHILTWFELQEKEIGHYISPVSAYYNDMTSLPEEHPELHEFMKAGGFSVQMSSDNPVDQTVEETVNKDTKTVELKVSS